MKQDMEIQVGNIIQEFLYAFQSKALPLSGYYDFIDPSQWGKLQTVGAWFPRTAFDKVTSKSENLAYGRFQGWEFKIKLLKGSQFADGPPVRSEIKFRHKTFGTMMAIASKGRFIGRTPKQYRPKYAPDVFYAYTDVNGAELLVPVEDLERELKRVAMMMKLQA